MGESQIETALEIGIGKAAAKCAVLSGHEDENEFIEIISHAIQPVIDAMRDRNGDLQESFRVAKAHLDANQGNYWSWQGDGEDHLESLVCPVVIQPRVLEKIIGERVSSKIQLAHEKTLTARARDALALLGTMPTLHEGNRASIMLTRKDYEFIQKTRQLK